jgi:phosphatidate phosphatase PAH1
MTSNTITQTGLSASYLKSAAAAQSSLEETFRNKVDIAIFQHLRSDLDDLKKSIVDGTLITNRKVDDGIEIDHHDEYVLGQLAKVDEHVAALDSRLLGLETTTQSFEKRMEERMRKIEKRFVVDENNLIKCEENVTLLSDTRILPLENMVRALQVDLRDLSALHHEKGERYDDEELRVMLSSLSVRLDEEGKLLREESGEKC